MFCVLLSYVVELVVGCESTFGMSFSGICWLVVGWIVFHVVEFVVE